MRLVDYIKENRDNKPKGFLTEFARVPEVMSPSYWFVTGAPGTGKTALVDQMFVLQPALEEMQHGVVYTSMERKIRDKKAKWIAYMIWKKEGILYDFPTIMQYHSKKKKFTDEDIELIAYYENWIDENIMKHMVIHTGPSTTGQVVTRFKDYYNANKDKYRNIIHISDHVGKVIGKGDMFTVLQKYSNNIGHLRDTTDAVFVDIVQLNTNKVNETNRRKAFGMEISVSDLYGGQIIPQNVDVGIGVLHPHKFGLTSQNGYDTNQFVPDTDGDSRFRYISTIKSSYQTEGRTAVNFIGEVGNFETLPPYTQLDENKIDLIKHPELRKLINNG